MKYLIILYISLFSTILFGQEVNIFNERLQNLLLQDDLRGASVAVYAIDLESGEVLADLNSLELLNPASVLKIPVTIAALKKLGGDFKFHTDLVYQGNLRNDTLNGDLVLIGGGDPSTASKYFNENLNSFLSKVVEDVKAAGISHITGSIIIDATHFKGDEIPRTRIWEDMANYYGAGAYGFNIIDNSFNVEFETSSVAGEPAELKSVYPDVPGLEIKSEVLAADISYDNAYIFGSPLDNKRIVRGELPKGRDSFTIKGSIPNPPAFAGYHIHRALKEAGIGLEGNYQLSKNPIPERATLKFIGSYDSEPLKNLVIHTNKNSDNLFAEAFLKQLAALKGQGSSIKGIEELKKFWKIHFQPGEPFFFYDGSGLSRFNAISSQQVVKMLQVANSDPEIKNVFFNSLPISGLEGSMRNMGKQSGLERNMRAKTGYMEGVRAYAGYFTSLSGKKMAFAFIVNNYSCSAAEMRRKMERVLIDLYELN